MVNARILLLIFENASEEMMTPKQEYEARKAARREKKLDANAKESEMVDLLDRFVTAIERIADVMERPKPSSLTFDPNSASGFKVANTTAV